VRFFSKNKKFHPNRFSYTINAIIQVNELREIKVFGSVFTWSNNQADHTLERLDRILMSKEWELLFPTVHGHKEPRNMSDHNPLLISTQLINVGNRRDFRFELTWLKHLDFLHKVDEIWSTPTRDKIPLNKFLFKLKKVKKVLKGWGFNLARSRKQKKKEITEEIADLELLEEIGNLFLEQSRRRIELKVDLFKILEEEELYWFRSRET
jgi:hypothetical protein